MQEPALSIKDRVKAIMSISDVAERFGVSRPTLYSFMVSYDEGEIDTIPESIRGFFDLVASTDDREQITVYLMTRSTPRDVSDLKPLKIKTNNTVDEFRKMQSHHDALVSSIESCECRLKDLDCHISDIDKECEGLRSLADIGTEGSGRYASMLSDLMAKRERLLKERDMMYHPRSRRSRETERRAPRPCASS